MPRYYLTELHGQSASGNSKKAPISFSVLDRAQNHEEVYIRYAYEGASNTKNRRAACERECERLNNLDPEPFDCAKGDETVHSP